jgi:hypothetical protein
MMLEIEKDVEEGEINPILLHEGETSKVGGEREWREVGEKKVSLSTAVALLQR